MKRVPSKSFWRQIGTNIPREGETEIWVHDDRPGMLGFDTSDGEYSPRYITLADLKRLIRESR